jgi:muramoyltetrapeptide carboxypeptidase
MRRTTARSTATSPASTSTAPPTSSGRSDITAIHLALAKHGPCTTFYGPTFTRFTRRKDELTDETKDWFHRAFKPEPLGRVFEDPENPYVLTIGGGSAEAPIVGRCMTLVCHSIGTPYDTVEELAAA